MQAAPDILHDIHDRGAAMYSYLATQYGEPVVERSLRRKDLYKVHIGGQAIVTLGNRGRQQLDIKNHKRPSPTRLLDQIADRQAIDHYEHTGWTFVGREARHILTFEHPTKTREFVIIKRTDYHPRSIRRLLANHAGALFQKGGTLVLYVRDPERAKRLQKTHRHRIEIRPFDELLDDVRPEVLTILREVPA